MDVTGKIMFFLNVNSPFWVKQWIMSPKPHFSNNVQYFKMPLSQRFTALKWVCTQKNSSFKCFRGITMQWSIFIFRLYSETKEKSTVIKPSLSLPGMLDLPVCKVTLKMFVSVHSKMQHLLWKKGIFKGIHLNSYFWLYLHNPDFKKSVTFGHCYQYLIQRSSWLVTTDILSSGTSSELLCGLLSVLEWKLWIIVVIPEQMWPDVYCS